MKKQRNFKNEDAIHSFKTEDNIDILYSSKAAYIDGVGAVITFSNRDFFEEDSTMLAPLVGREKRVVKWGADNLQPNHVLKIAEDNPVASASLEFLIDVGFGSGIKLGTYDDEDNFKPYSKQKIREDAALKSINQFMIDNDIQGVLSEILTDLKWFYQTCIEFQFDRNEKQKIASVAIREMLFSRWEEPDEKNNIINHLYSSKWGKNQTDTDIISTPVLDMRKPLLDLKRRVGIVRDYSGEFNKVTLDRVIYPIQLFTPGRKLYPRPYWYSIISSGWLEFANRIPEFKKVLMKNILAVAFHVEISHDYFPKIMAKEGIKDKKAQEARIKQEYSDIKKFLQGAENAGSTIITYFKVTPDGKVFIPDIKITPIERKFGGEWIEDSHEASAMTYTAMRVHPNLIGQVPGKSSGSMSGSDKRELLRIAQSLQGRIRDRALMFLYVIKEINGWPEDLEFSITDIILTTLDQGKEVEKMNVV